jgi:hypothetical protein
MPSPVTETEAAPPALAAEHFARRLAFETDCADVHDALARGAADFVLLEARGPAAYARGHVPGARNLPHRESRRSASPPGRATRCSSSTAPGRTATAPTARRCAWRGSAGG